MISVQNLRPRLNGNSIWLLLVAVCFLQCKTLQQTTQTTTDPQVDHPRQPTVDTIKWSDPVDDEVIIVDADIDDNVDIDVSTEVSQNKLAIILPLETESMNFESGQISARHEALVHYYVGVKLGLDKIEDLRVPLEVVIKDSHQDKNYLNQILDELKNNGVNYIFGGKGKSQVGTIAEFAKEQEITYVNGWQLNSGFIGENRHYVQLNPGFHAHILTILKHALQEFNSDQLILFGSRKEESRIGEINRLYKEITGSEELLETFIVENMEELEELEMLEWTEDPEEKVFIVPVTRDINLIHDFFRFLDFNELHEKSIVYGMTDWNSEVLYSHLNNFDVRLTSFWNPDISSSFSEFEESFYSITGTLPEEKAYEGYGHAILMGDIISKAQQNDGIQHVLLEAPGMAAFLVDHNILEYPGIDRSIMPSYYENKHVYLLGFKDFRYFILPDFND